MTISSDNLLSTIDDIDDFSDMICTFRNEVKMANMLRNNIKNTSNSPKDNIQALKQVMLSDKNNEKTHAYLYTVLGDVVSYHADYLNVKSGHSGKTDEYFLKLSAEAIDVLNIGLQSDKNDENSIRNAYYAIKKIAFNNYVSEMKNKALTQKALNSVLFGLKTGKNSAESLRYAYGVMTSVVMTDDNFAQETLQALKLGLASDKNNEISLDDARYTLRTIIRANKELQSEMPKELNIPEPKNEIEKTEKSAKKPNFFNRLTKFMSGR